MTQIEADKWKAVILVMTTKARLKGLIAPPASTRHILGWWEKIQSWVQ